ncbi:CAAX prenyl protease [Coemansia erecta]|uniref:intramembrane prenyl-peptidase Rce1 n=1 Tax=Coemansia erecta TaxID=147472 RepID=A0A9W7XZV1_9FUNG|nr:CAAX prenyl protease [Coemansia erecta]
MSIPVSALHDWRQALAPSVSGAVTLSVLLAALYVFSIYASQALSPLANVSTHDRDHPEVIRRRMRGAVTATALSLALTALVLGRWRETNDGGESSSSSSSSVVALLGLEVGRVPASVFVSLVLCATAYLGPLVLDHVDSEETFRADTAADAPAWWTRAYRKAVLVWRQPIPLRNYVVGPLTEELVFRSCVVSLWTCAGISLTRTIYLSPFVFALAHVHHAFGQLRNSSRSSNSSGGSNGQGIVRRILLVTCAQIVYTSMFGWLAVALMVRTRSVAGPVAAHAFCNYRGLPDFARVARCRPVVRYPVVLTFVLGLGAFAVLFEPMTREGVFIS